MRVCVLAARRFFGGGGGFGGQQQQEEEVRKGHTVYVDLQCTLKDLYVGKELKVSRPAARGQRTAPHCTAYCHGAPRPRGKARP